MRYVSICILIVAECLVGQPHGAGGGFATSEYKGDDECMFVPPEHHVCIGDVSVLNPFRHLQRTYRRQVATGGDR